MLREVALRFKRLAARFAPEGEEGVFSADKPNFNVEVAEGQGAMADYEARAILPLL
jgi:hypothetical protein